MIFNRITRTRPIFAHAPGKPEYTPLWPAVRSLAMTMPVRSCISNDLTIVTFNNGSRTSYNDKLLGTLERSLELSGVPCVVLGHGIKNWKNKYKLFLMQDFVSKLDTPYVLFSDSSDVVLVNYLDDIINRFRTMECRACFNAEKKVWPLDLPEHIVRFESSLHPTMYLNAGLWISESSFASHVITECLATEVETSHSQSEQVYYKFCYRSLYPELVVDYGCSIFQGLNRVSEDEIYISKIY